MSTGTPNGMTSYPVISCELSFDDKNQNEDFWAKVLTCRPQVGEFVCGLNGRRGLIESIEHTFYIGEREDRDDQYQIPVLRLHIKVTNSGKD